VFYEELFKFSLKNTII